MPISRRSAFSCRAVGARILPSNSIVPLSGRSSPLITRRSVLFPEPLRPMTATTSPGSTASDTSSSARCAPKRLEMLLNAKSGIDAPFEGLGQQRQRPAQEEIERRDRRVDDHRLERRFVQQLAARGQLYKTDARG